MKKVGIVIKKVTDEYIEGVLSSFELIKDKEEFSQFDFKLTLGKRKILTVPKCVEISKALEIWSELTYIGFKDVALVFNNKKINIPPRWIQKSKRN